MILNDSFLEFNNCTLSLLPIWNFSAAFWPLSNFGNFFLFNTKAMVNDEKVNIAVTYSKIRWQRKKTNKVFYQNKNDRGKYFLKSFMVPRQSVQNQLPEQQFAKKDKARNTNCRLSTVDLLIKVPCFITKVNNSFNMKSN